MLDTYRDTISTLLLQPNFDLLYNFFLLHEYARNVATKASTCHTYLHIIRQMLQNDVAFYENATYKKKVTLRIILQH
jgi:hypothetical protein